MKYGPIENLIKVVKKHEILNSYKKIGFHS